MIGQLVARYPELNVLKEHVDRGKIEDKFVINEMFRAANIEAVELVS